VFEQQQAALTVHSQGSYSSLVMEEAHPIWKNQVVIAAVIVLFFPLGLFLMWRYAPWRTVLKWLWTILVILIFITVFLRPPSDEPDTFSGYEIPVDAPSSAFL